MTGCCDLRHIICEELCTVLGTKGALSVRTGIFFLETSSHSVSEGEGVSGHLALPHLPALDAVVSQVGAEAP